MVLSAEEEISVAKEKQKIRVEFENLQHKHMMEGLNKQLEIAKVHAEVFKGTHLLKVDK